MTKKELIEKVRHNTGYLKKDITEIVEQIFQVMAEELIDNDKIMINNFGTFNKVYQKPYIGVNANTGEPLKVDGAYHIRFISSNKLREFVNKKK